MKICKNCKWFRNFGEKDNMIWYNLRCSHPDLEKKPEINPVTGELSFAGTNDLGGKYYDTDIEYKHPYCKDINTDGKCKYYKDKKLKVVK